jgi:phosphatidylglycerophosphate synthase
VTSGGGGLATKMRRTNAVDRRPIAARGWPVARWASSWLNGHGVLPNTISIAGMVCGIGAGVVLAVTGPAPRGNQPTWLIAGALILMRAAANMLDGMVAVEFHRASPLGDLYNELPDRVSDMAMLVGLGYAAGGNVTLGYAAAGAALLVAYIRTLGKAAGARQEFGGPMAKQRRMFTVVGLSAYMGLAPHAWQPLWGSPPRFGLAAACLGVVIVGCVGRASCG